MNRLTRLVASVPPIVWWILLVAWAGLIFCLSAQPNLVIAHEVALDLLLRKGAHFVVFLVLAGLAFLAFHFSGAGRSPAWAFVLAAVYAALDELHQGFVVGRTPFLGDWAVDLAGAAVGVVVLSRWFRAGE